MSSVLTISAPYYTENNMRYVFIDGNACRKIDACYAILQEQLSIPNYFGKNLDALEEILSDMDWIAEKKVKLILSNTHALLDKDLSKKAIFMNILHTCQNEKIEITCLGVPD